MLTLWNQPNSTEDNIDLSAILNGLSNPIIVLSTRGIIQYINPAGHRLLNKDIGQRFFAGFNHKTATAFKELSIKIDGAGIQSFSVEIQPIFWKSKRAHLLALNDISDIKRREAKERKEEMLENLQQLAGAIAHEFSQPLQILNHLYEIIEMDGLTENRMKKCRDMTTRLTELVRSMRNMLALRKMPYLSDEIIDLNASALAEGMKKSLKLSDVRQA